MAPGPGRPGTAAPPRGAGGRVHRRAVRPGPGRRRDPGPGGHGRAGRLRPERTLPVLGHRPAPAPRPARGFGPAGRGPGPALPALGRRLRGRPQRAHGGRGGAVRARGFPLPGGPARRPPGRRRGPAPGRAASALHHHHPPGAQAAVRPRHAGLAGPAAEPLRQSQFSARTAHQGGHGRPARHPGHALGGPRRVQPAGPGGGAGFGPAGRCRPPGLRAGPGHAHPHPLRITPAVRTQERPPGARLPGGSGRGAGLPGPGRSARGGTVHARGLHPPADRGRGHRPVLRARARDPRHDRPRRRRAAARAGHRRARRHGAADRAGGTRPALLPAHAALSSGRPHRAAPAPPHPSGGHGAPAPGGRRLPGVAAGGADLLRAAHHQSRDLPGARGHARHRPAHPLPAGIRGGGVARPARPLPPVHRGPAPAADRGRTRCASAGDGRAVRRGGRDRGALPGGPAPRHRQGQAGRPFAARRGTGGGHRPAAAAVPRGLRPARLPRPPPPVPAGERAAPGLHGPRVHPPGRGGGRRRPPADPALPADHRRQPGHRAVGLVELEGRPGGRTLPGGEDLPGRGRRRHRRRPRRERGCALAARAGGHPAGRRANGHRPGRAAGRLPARLQPPGGGPPSRHPPGTGRPAAPAGAAVRRARGAGLAPAHHG